MSTIAMDVIMSIQQTVGFSKTTTTAEPNTDVSNCEVLLSKWYPMFFTRHAPKQSSRHVFGSLNNKALAVRLLTDSPNHGELAARDV
jgi:hypothetical protein